MTPDDRALLLARLAEALEPRSEILEAYLFGSRATGSAQAHSDFEIRPEDDEAFAAAGDIYRYLGDEHNARNYVERAEQIKRRKTR